MNNTHKNLAAKPIILSVNNLKQKVRQVRQSQPNLFFEDFNLASKRQKFESQTKFQNTNKLPRSSQTLISINSCQNLHGCKHQTQKEGERVGFLSPTYIKKPFNMVKSRPNCLSHYENEGSKLVLKTQLNRPQIKNRKNPIQSHKETLTKIQQMLVNHGAKINRKLPQLKSQDQQIKAKKSIKSPRFSEDPNIPLHNEKYQSKVVQRDSLNHKIIINQSEEIDQRLLKQTVSTTASNKNSQQIKLSHFQIGKQIGKGKFGVVKIVKHKKTGMVFCLKIIKKKTIQKQQLIQQLIKQIKIQSYLKHPNITKLYSVFYDEQNIYLLLQLCCDGNLYGWLQKKKKVEQNQIKPIIKNVCDAVLKLHQQNIIHRDLKPQNIILCFGMAKICDFGWSTSNTDAMRQTFCGTPLYVSPQLVNGSCYDQKVDLWAIGVIAYEMMTGKIPFEIKSQRDLYKIVNDKIVYPHNMSSQAISFLEDLLEKDAMKRKNIAQIINHEFLYKKL